MSETLLTLNAGSSSLKFRLFRLEDGLPYVLGGKIDGIGGTPIFRVHWQEQSRDESMELPSLFDIDSAVSFTLDWLNRQPGHRGISAAAHRIVHGGTRDGATELNADILDELAAFSPLAPQHQPHNLSAVRSVWKSFPGLTQFGCFDTAFHAHIGPLASQFALPHYITAKGIRRYGYHGLSYAWIAESLKRDFPVLARGRVVAAHLGNGSSACAMLDGRSVDTTMGLTALDGLPMGTRSGALDPGVILHLQKQHGMTADQVECMLYEQSGLKGLSGISNDVKLLLSSEAPDARFALDYFAHKAAQHIASMAVSIGGMDALVFSGGIGENAEPVRRAIIERLDFLTPFAVHVIAANEERAMAGDVLQLIIQSSLAKNSVSTTGD